MRRENHREADDYLYANHRLESRCLNVRVDALIANWRSKGDQIMVVTFRWRKAEWKENNHDQLQSQNLKVISTPKLAKQGQSLCRALKGRRSETSNFRSNKKKESEEVKKQTAQVDHKLTSLISVLIVLFLFDATCLTSFCLPPFCGFFVHLPPLQATQQTGTFWSSEHKLKRHLFCFAFFRHLFVRLLLCLLQLTAELSQQSPFLMLYWKRTKNFTMWTS